MIHFDAEAKGRGFLAPLERTYSPIDTRWRGEHRRPTEVHTDGNIRSGIHGAERIPLNAELVSRCKGSGVRPAQGDSRSEERKN